MAKKNGLEFYTTRKPKNALPIKRGEKIKWIIDYRWRIRRNGRIIAASTQGYSRMRWCVINTHSICAMLTQANIHKAVLEFNKRYL